MEIGCDGGVCDTVSVMTSQYFTNNETKIFGLLSERWSVSWPRNVVCIFDKFAGNKNFINCERGVPQTDGIWTDWRAWIPSTTFHNIQLRV